MEEITETKMDANGIKRNEDGTFAEGYIGGPGRPPMTEEQKIIKKAQKELIADYKQALAEALPEITPVLVAKAIEGDIQAIKELNDRVMGKSLQSVESKMEVSMNIEISEVIANKNNINATPSNTESSCCG